MSCTHYFRRSKIKVAQEKCGAYFFICIIYLCIARTHALVTTHLDIHSLSTRRIDKQKSQHSFRLPSKLNSISTNELRLQHRIRGDFSVGHWNGGYGGNGGNGNNNNGGGGRRENEGDDGDNYWNSRLFMGLSMIMTSSSLERKTIMASLSTLIADTSLVLNNRLRDLLLPSLQIATEYTGMIARQYFVNVSQSTRSIISWYLLQLKKNPLVTKSISSGIIGTCGDYGAQWLGYILRKRRHRQEGQYTLNVSSMSPSKTNNNILSRHFSTHSTLFIYGNYDFCRGLSLLADGLFISGPLMHFGYLWFEKLVPIQSGGSKAAILHVLADSILLDSIFVATTITTSGLFEGLSIKGDVLPQLQNEYWNTLKASWTTSLSLMPLEFFCFRSIPVNYRSMAMDSVDVIWSCTVSHMAHKSRS